MRALRRRGSVADEVHAAAPGRPIVLATLGVPFDSDAASLAVDAAVEAGQPLLLVNLVEIFPGPGAVVLRYGDVDEAPDDATALRAPAELAHSLGVEVSRLRVRSPHPVGALLELTADRRPGLLVFGPDRQRLKPRAYRKAAKAIRERASCLVWIAD